MPTLRRFIDKIDADEDEGGGCYFAPAEITYRHHDGYDCGENGLQIAVGADYSRLQATLSQRNHQITEKGWYRYDKC